MKQSVDYKFIEALNVACEALVDNAIEKKLDFKQELKQSLNYLFKCQLRYGLEVLDADDYKRLFDEANGFNLK